MMPYELPKMSAEGGVEEQLKEIKSFLYRQAEMLNYNLKQTSVESFWAKTAEALSVSANEEVEDIRRSEYRALRGLVIKSATSVIKNEDTFCAEYSGDYFAESPYGTLKEEGKFYVDGNPFTINQLWKYQSEIINENNLYKTELEGFINTGVLDRDSDNPVFGMDIGYNKNKYTVNGKEYNNENPAKIRVTPVKISFFSGDNEVAYLNETAIYFPLAHITGGKININNVFKVDPDGKMTATSGSFKGSIEAASGNIGGFSIAGKNVASNGVFNWSISSVIRTDQNTISEDKPAYAVILRGQNPEGTGGAYQSSNMVFGVKKATVMPAKAWANENGVSTVFAVYADGRMKATEGTIGGFTIKGEDGGDLLPNSLSAIHTAADKTVSEQYPQYFVYLKSGTDSSYGSTIVLGSIKRTSENTTWLNARNQWAITADGTFLISKLVVQKGTNQAYLEFSDDAIVFKRSEYYHSINSEGKTVNDFEYHHLLNGNTYVQGNFGVYSADVVMLKTGNCYHRIKKTATTVDGFQYYHLFAGNARFNNLVYFSDATIYMKGPEIKFYTSQAVSGSNWLTALFFGTVDGVSAFHIGMAGKKTRLWGSEVALSSGAAVTSDERKKKEFESFGEAHEKMFELIEPKIFKYLDGTSDRKHFGFVAQQIERSIEGAGLTTKDVAAFIRSELENGAGDELSLRYDEFIALNTHMIKKCFEVIRNLKTEIETLKQTKG